MYQDTITSDGTLIIPSFIKISQLVHTCPAEGQAGTWNSVTK
jgi:hypothetical protein